jgi:hypothetical protein
MAIFGAVGCTYFCFSSAGRFCTDVEGEDCLDPTRKLSIVASAMAQERCWVKIQLMFLLF